MKKLLLLMLCLLTVLPYVPVSVPVSAPESAVVDFYWYWTFRWLYPDGYKMGYIDGPYCITDGGSANYHIRITIDVCLLAYTTIMTKATFTNMRVKLDPMPGLGVDISISPPLSRTTSMFLPSYNASKDIPYYSAFIMWINFTQTQATFVDVEFEYTMLYTDMTLDGKVDGYDLYIMATNWRKSYTPYNFSASNPTCKADVWTNWVVDGIDLFYLARDWKKSYPVPTWLTWNDPWQYVDSTN